MEEILKRFITQEDENFVYIVGFPKYIISNYGHVYSLQKRIPRKLKHTKRINRHSTVLLYNDKGKSEKSVYKLIEETFKTRDSSYKVLPHFKDGNIRNFTPGNIIYSKKVFTPLPGDTIIKSHEQITQVARKIIINLGYTAHLFRNSIIFDMYCADDLISEIVMLVMQREKEYGGMSENFAFTIGKNLLLGMAKTASKNYVYKIDRMQMGRTGEETLNYDLFEPLMCEDHIEEKMIQEEKLIELLILLTEEEEMYFTLRVNGFSLSEIAAELSMNILDVIKLDTAIKGKLKDD